MEDSINVITNNHYDTNSNIELLSHKGKNIFCIEEVKQYIIQNIDENITVKEICKALNLSESHFIRTFKDKTTITPYSYIQNEKVKKAKELLLKEFEISEVAFMLGFSDQSHLNRVFKKYTYLTPHKYKTLFFNKN